MAWRIFIDGMAGTTGLQIRERLFRHSALELLTLPEARRKDLEARRDMLNTADLAVLCLPDEAAREAVSLIEAPDDRIIDASTAHRVAPEWAYGFPEMTQDQSARIAAAKRVSNPGCYSTAAIALLRPLVEAGVLPDGFPVTVNAVSGYSGGGRKLIESFEDPAADQFTESPFWLYGLDLAHKHLPEMQHHIGLETPPVFVPSVGRFAQGMLASVPLALRALPGAPQPRDLQGVLEAHYAGAHFVRVIPAGRSGPIARLEPESLNGTNEMHLHVFGSPDGQRALLVAQLDNLGKGASGAAVQNLNIMLGFDEAEGLTPQHAA
jgi:N-acetyl-gamma-glutamyl-phosphate reductase